MLVLTRKIDETIVIETPKGLVSVTVLHVKGDRVSIGIDAPNEINIKRKELLDGE